jgi:hypothetical protein
MSLALVSTTRNIPFLFLTTTHIAILVFFEPDPGRKGLLCSVAPPLKAGFLPVDESIVAQRRGGVDLSPPLVISCQLYEAWRNVPTRPVQGSDGHLCSHLPPSCLACQTKSHEFKGK